MSETDQNLGLWGTTSFDCEVFKVYLRLFGTCLICTNFDSPVA